MNRQVVLEKALAHPLANQLKDSLRFGVLADFVNFDDVLAHGALPESRLVDEGLPIALQVHRDYAHLQHLTPVVRNALGYQARQHPEENAPPRSFLYRSHTTIQNECRHNQ
mmetsp:Transcript_1786/g.2531  ORF Transcript_1786/g.2531 Transcript_1786/m.2531 type:complete len:111 (-) Transcript_1786:429-761(-)